VPGFPDGAFYLPTVIVEAAQNSEIVQQEVFGPVLVVLPFDTEEEALRMANDAPTAWRAPSGRATCGSPCGRRRP
jgi:acyl-CoA reductase-like NAD-dependent aldehyde dehydrogenase